MESQALRSDEQAIREVWSNYWRTHAELGEGWDSLSEVVLQAVVREAGGVRGRRVMEAGCGTGRISLRLARAGGEVTCLDVAPEALELARRNFADQAPARFLHGSILDMPRDAAYDVVWNAGVVEHFVPEDQRRAIGEFLAVLKPGGKIILLTPWARSPLYRLSKALLESRGKWPYGRETPVRTLGDVVPESGRLVRECPVSFLPFFLDTYKFVPRLRGVCRSAYRVMTRLLGLRGFAAVDRVLSRILGGYLLVSVIEARDARP